jgi:3-ketosteroid 9alpha-monooxygenase subunit B
MTSTTISEIRRESPAAVTLRLDLGGAPLDYRPGQYVMIDPHQFPAIEQAVREREAKRSRTEGPGYFSLSSDATDPRSVEVTVKAAPGSPAPLPHFLVREAAVGLPVAFEGPAGRYCLPLHPPAGIRGFLHVCAGSGLAPNRGMIRHALARRWPQRHVLLIQDRAEEDLLFRGEWKELADRHPDLLRVRTSFSSNGGYLTPEMVRDAMEGFIDIPSSLAFLCGPNQSREGRAGFMDAWKAHLRGALGFEAGRVITES